MYILLQRVFKNVSDFLIFDSCRKLIESFSPDRKFLVLDAWDNLDNQILC